MNHASPHFIMRSGILAFVFALLLSSYFFTVKGSSLPLISKQTSSQQDEDVYRLDKVVLHGDSITQVLAN